MTQPTTHYVISRETQKHKKLAFIGCDRDDDRPTAWFITEDPERAYDFQAYWRAKDFCDQLNKGDAEGLKNDGHLWRISHSL